MASRKKTTKKPTRGSVRAPIRKTVRKSAGAHRDSADSHAADELVLYIDNTSDLSLMGPSGQGHSVALNALRKWRKGVYQPELAVNLFGYLVEAGAKRYAKEFDSPSSWSTMFTPATRELAARELEKEFRRQAEQGEFDHLDKRSGAIKESARKASPRSNPDQRAVDFFLKNAGYGYGPGETPEQGKKRGAIKLAKAEQEATARGWHVKWEEDPEGWDSLGDIDPDDVKEILVAVLYDENGEVLGSLGSIVNPDREYGRVVEAELALEALPSEVGVRETSRRPVRHPHHARRARESGRDRPIGMTYGTLPPFHKFERDIRRVDPDSSNGEPYLAAGELYPMELVGAHEIELADGYGLDQFEADRKRTGRNSGVRGFKANESELYSFLEYLTEEFNNGDEEAGDLASSIMTTLGYEWI